MYKRKNTFQNKLSFAKLLATFEINRLDNVVVKHKE